MPLILPPTSLFMPVDSRVILTNEASALFGATRSLVIRYTKIPVVMTLRVVLSILKSVLNNETEEKKFVEIDSRVQEVQ